MASSWAALHIPEPFVGLQEAQDVVEVEVEDREGEEKAVDSIERSPVAGQEDARIFHACGALELRGEDVAQLDGPPNEEGSCMSVIRLFYADGMKV